MLFDWSFVTKEEREKLGSILFSREDAKPRKGLAAAEALHGFFRPLFSAYTFAQLPAKNDTDDAREKNMQARTPAASALRPLVSLLERGDTASAFTAAVNRYKSLLQTTANFGENTFPLTNADTRRLLATLLLPAAPASVAQAFSRWALPAGKQR